jgi:hypothetical protein
MPEPPPVMKIVLPVSFMMDISKWIQVRVVVGVGQQARDGGNMDERIKPIKRLDVNALFR